MVIPSAASTCGAMVEVSALIDPQLLIEIEALAIIE
jgi:hypothetical protein